MAAESFGFSIFCDDIRYEVGGKTSLIGLYELNMIFPKSTSFPVVLPKFALVAKYFETFGSFSGELALNVFLPGDDAGKPSFNQAINRAAAVNNIMDADMPEDAERVFAVSTPIVFSPLQIVTEGFIRVRMLRDGQLVQLGSLQIRKARQDEQISGLNLD